MRCDYRSSPARLGSVRVWPDAPRLSASVLLGRPIAVRCGNKKKGLWCVGRSHGYNAADETLPVDYLPDVQRLVQNGIGRPTGGRVRVDNLQGIPARYEPLDRSVVSKPSEDQNAGSTRRPNRHAQD